MKTPHFRALACLLAAFLLTVATGCGRTQDTGPLRAEIQARYDAMNDAVQKKDLAAYMAPIAENFTLVQANGRKFDRSRLETSTADMFKTGDLKSKTQLREVTLDGGQAIVVADSQQSGTFTDARGEKHKFEATSTSRDVWNKTQAGWQLISMVETAHNSTVDGKPQSDATSGPGTDLPATSPSASAARPTAASPAATPMAASPAATPMAASPAATPTSSASGSPMPAASASASPSSAP